MAALLGLCKIILVGHDDCSRKSFFHDDLLQLSTCVGSDLDEPIIATPAPAARNTAAALADRLCESFLWAMMMPLFNKNKVWLLEAGSGVKMRSDVQEDGGKESLRRTVDFDGRGVLILMEKIS